MANCKILRHAGGNILRHDTGVILRHDDTCTDGSSGGLALRLRRKLKQVLPPQPFRIEEEFEKMFMVKPTLARTNDISMKGIPLLRQHMMRLMDFMFKPTAQSYETVSNVTINPKKHKDVHFGVRVRFTTTTEMSKLLKASVISNDYSHTGLQG